MGVGGRLHVLMFVTVKLRARKPGWINHWDVLDAVVMVVVVVIVVVWMVVGLPWPLAVHKTQYDLKTKRLLT